MLRLSFRACAATLQSKSSQFVISLLFAVPIVHLLHLAAIDPTATRTQTALLIPDGSAVRYLSLGQQTTVADAFWLRLVQYIGTTESQAAGYPQLFELVQMITDVDQEYGYAYMVGGLLLAAHGRVDQSSAILEKGATYAPSRWEIPFYLAFNYWFELDNALEGARWLSKAAEHPDAPPFLNDLLPRLYSSAGLVDAAIEFTSRMLGQASTEQERQILSERIEALHLEKDLQALEQAISGYRSVWGHPPPRLEDLVPAFLPSLPASTAAMRYNPLTANIESPLLLKRIAPAKPEGF